MSYIVPFQSIALFENTFKHQINKKTGEVENRKFVFNKKFGRTIQISIPNSFIPRAKSSIAFGIVESFSIGYKSVTSSIFTILYYHVY